MHPTNKEILVGPFTTERSYVMNGGHQPVLAIVNGLGEGQRDELALLMAGLLNVAYPAEACREQLAEDARMAGV